MKNQKVFVMGHKNPDTDSICSAIAYADIKNRTTQTKRYIPRRAGQINEETQYVLNRFGVQPPAPCLMVRLRHKLMVHQSP